MVKIMLGWALKIMGAARMRILILTGFSLALLAACGQKSDREVLTEACMADGESREACDCITSAMESNLSPDLMKRTAAAIGREKRDVEDFVGSLTMDEQMEFAGVIAGMVMCEVSEAESGDG